MRLPSFHALSIMLPHRPGLFLFLKNTAVRDIRVKDDRFGYWRGGAYPYQAAPGAGRSRWCRRSLRRLHIQRGSKSLAGRQRWLGKFGQQDKWTFCLTTAQDAESRREYEQTIPPEP